MLNFHYFWKRKNWSPVSVLFAFCEAENANLNLYRRLLKNIQTIYLMKIKAGCNGFFPTIQVLVQQRALRVIRQKRGTWGSILPRVLFKRERQPAEPSASLVPALVKACKGPFLIYKEEIQVFSFLIPSSLIVWDVGNALKAVPAWLIFWKEVLWFSLALLCGVPLTEENESWLQGMVQWVYSCALILHPHLHLLVWWIWGSIP